LAIKHSVPLFFTGGVILGVVFIVLGAIFPRAFCGWACPIGFVVRILGVIGNKLKLTTKIPVRLNDRLAWLAVLVFAYLVLLTAVSGRMFCVGGCPLFWGYSACAVPIGAMSIAFLAFFLTGSMFIERFFCRWICPYGAVLGIIGRFSIFAISKRETECGACKVCSKCPMGTLPKDTPVVVGPMCISCLECVDVCPRSRLFMGKRKSKKEDIK